MKMRVLGGLVLLVGVGAGAQTTEAELRAKLVDKPLYLRGCYGEDKLRFDAGGQVRDKVHLVPFTVSGVDVDGVELKSGKLVLKGRRMGVKFDHDTPEQIPLAVGRFNDLHDEGIEIEIAARASHDYSTVLGQVFAFDLKEMAPAMPDEWKTWAGHALLGEERRPAHSGGNRRVGGGVTAPRVLHAPEPEFSEYARRLKVSGNVMVYLIVGTEGVPESVRIVRPLGLGLDEQAVKAVRGYKFSPAMENDVPVKVEMQVEVNFQIF